MIFRLNTWFPLKRIMIKLIKITGSSLEPEYNHGDYLVTTKIDSDFDTGYLGTS